MNLTYKELTEAGREAYLNGKSIDDCPALFDLYYCQGITLSATCSDIWKLSHRITSVRAKWASREVQAEAA